MFVALLIFLCLLVFFIAQIVKAPEGAEDDDGFHFINSHSDKPPRKRH